MKPMPLLPRPWSLPLTILGEANSTCSWQSPKGCLVSIRLTAVVPPSSSTFHLSALFQASKFLPSNSTMASEGGPLSVPGVMSLGIGQILPSSKRLSWNSPRPLVRNKKVATKPPSMNRAGLPARRERTDFMGNILLLRRTDEKEHCAYRKELGGNRKRKTESRKDERRKHERIRPFSCFRLFVISFRCKTGR